jgi:hypothetical protein
MLMSIRLISLVTGGLCARIPRSLEWKISLYTSRQLMVMAVVVEHSVTIHSLDPLRSFIRDSCGPFLLALSVVELSMKALSGNDGCKTTEH